MALGDSPLQSFIGDTDAEAPPIRPKNPSRHVGPIQVDFGRWIQEKLIRDIGVHPSTDRPFQPTKARRAKFFLGGGTGVAITDFTPTRPGTRRRLGSF